MITNLTYVNNFPVRAMLTDETSETSQTIVVCDRGAHERDRYVVWTVAMISGKVEARHGRYVPTYARALTVAAERAAEPQKADNSPKAIAQRAWDSHYAIACSEDSAVCVSDSPIYKASRALLLASIRQAYGLSSLMAARVYDALIENGEPVAWSVEYVRSQSRRPRTVHPSDCDCLS